MNFSALPSDHMRALVDLGPKTKRIAARAELLLSCLLSTIDEQRAFQDAGLQISRSDDSGGIANVATPIGNGRIVYGWEISNRVVYGTLVVERKRRDQYDRIQWEPVWGMKIPEYEDPFSSSVGHGLIIPLDDTYGDHRRRALCEAIISIVYGIVNGPMLVEE